MEKPEIRVKPNTYQPTKKELEKDASINATPEEVIKATFSPAKTVQDPEA